MSRHEPRNKLILLVTCSTFNEENIREFLEIHDFSVLAADTEDVALELMRVFKPDLVLYDTRQASVTGKRLLELKQANPSIADIPLVILTSSPKEIDNIVALSLGAKYCLVHPFNVTTLMDAIQRYL